MPAFFGNRKPISRQSNELRRLSLTKNSFNFTFSMENHLEQVFTHLRASYMSLESRLKAEGFKLRVLQVFKAWEEWNVYPRDYLTKLKHIFLGLSLVGCFLLKKFSTFGHSFLFTVKR